MISTDQLSSEKVCYKTKDDQMANQMKTRASATSDRTDAFFSCFGVNRFFYDAVKTTTNKSLRQVAGQLLLPEQQIRKYLLSNYLLVLAIVRTVLTVRRRLRGKLSQRFRTLTDSVGRSPISDDISELYTTKDGPSSNPRILPPSSTRLSDDMETISGQPRSPNNGLVTAREL